MTANIKSETVLYTAGGANLVGYLAWDASRTGKRPGVVLFGEWWGLNDYLKRRAREVAALGYVALAADMYGDGRVAADAAEAGRLMNGLFADMPGTNARISATIDHLARHPDVDPARVGAMGYCLGGALSLHAARLGLPLAGVASFHGSLGKTHAARPGEFKARALVCHGADDSLVSAEELDGFRKEMADLGVDLDFVSYPGAKHGFTNPDATENGRKYGLPLAYDEAVDRQSWARMKAFWASTFA